MEMEMETEAKTDTEMETDTEAKTEESASASTNANPNPSKWNMSAINSINRLNCIVLFASLYFSMIGINCLYAPFSILYYFSFSSLNLFQFYF
jgi:hypothetical protein